MKSNFGQFSQANISTTFGVKSSGATVITPGISTSFTYQLSNHLSSSLSWKAGMNSSMKGSLYYDNQTMIVSTAVQVCRNTHKEQDLDMFSFSLECRIHLEQ